MMETFFTVSQQTWLFLWSCVIGVGLGVVYDMFRVARIILKHNKTGVFIEDFFFILFSAVVILIYCTEMARGEIRFFIVIGAFLGFIVYILTVGIVVVTIAKKIVMIISKVLRYIYKLIFYPIIKLFVRYCQKIKGCFVKNCSKLFKKSIIIKKPLKRIRGLVYNKSTHKHGKKKRGVKIYGKVKAKKVNAYKT